YDFPEEIRNSRTKSGQTHIQNRAGWAMSSLVKAKFIAKHPTEKFTYEITQAGRDYLDQHQGPITPEDLENLDGYIEAWEEASRRKQKAKGEVPTPAPKVETRTPDELIEAAIQELDEELRTSLLEHLLNSNPYHFEQIVIDVLVAMGYGGSREEAAQVTQKSNDGGIDGIINEDRLGLDVIYVQAKRYLNKVGRVDIQNFVGALAGNQAHKGIFITTSGYNDNAIEYARTVPQKVILIDGQRLAELMIEHNVGVSTENTIEIKQIDSDYFEDS
ncbi:MAG: restriction endonuclease, partial [Verrucomicrobiota bacterium]